MAAEYDKLKTGWLRRLMDWMEYWRLIVWMEDQRLMDWIEYWKRIEIPQTDRLVEYQRLVS